MSSKSSDTSKYIVFGLQRSGTTFTQRVIEMNTKLELDTSAWKHTMPPVDTCALKVMVTKSPYNWASSIVTRNRVDVLWKWRKYRLRDRGEAMWRDINLEHLIKLWNDWHNAWIEHDVLHVQYEQLLRDAFTPMKLIGMKSGSQVTLPPSIDVSTDRFFIPLSRREEYLKHHLNSRVVEQINRFIDRSLLDKLGYTLVK